MIKIKTFYCCNGYIGASLETEEVINCIYQSSEIESDKGSIVAEKPSDVFNDSDSNELETDNV